LISFGNGYKQKIPPEKTGRTLVAKGRIELPSASGGYEPDELPLSTTPKSTGNKKA